MGAIIFQTGSRKTDVNEAYRECVERARQEHGSDPYSGTIATTHGFTVIKTEPVYVPISEALERAEAALDGRVEVAAVPIFKAGAEAEGPAGWVFAGWGRW